MDNILQQIITTLTYAGSTALYFWPIIAGGLGLFFLAFLAKKRYDLRRRREWLARQKYVLLSISVPRNNEKTPLAAEQMFASLHGILKTTKQLKAEGSVQEHIGFEIVAQDKYITFYIFTPYHLKDFVEGQVYAQYPTVEVKEIEDYTDSLSNDVYVLGTEIKLVKSFAYPIKTFVSFEVDPLASITAVLSKLDNPGEQTWIQILARPVSDNWQKKALGQVQRVKTGNKVGVLGKILEIILAFAKAFSGPVKEEPKKQEAVKLAGPVEQALKGIETKSTKLGYETKIRVMVAAQNVEDAKNRLQAVVGTFKQFNLINMNGFVGGKVETNREKALAGYRRRTFVPGTGYILNIEELASIYHLPNESVETPNIVWAGAKKGEPPANLPTRENSDEKELTVFAKTNFRHVQSEFGIKKEDKTRHTYIIGKSGMGKSNMMENMAIQDVLHGCGIGVVDPHGETVDAVLKYMPENRIEDVVMFDPSDSDHPVAFNLLENVDPRYKDIVSSGLIAIFKKIWFDSWGPRLEHILRNTILALLENEDTTLLGIPKMLTDTVYRKKMVANVKDPVVRAFWEDEYAQYTDKFRNEAIAPILNKIGQFLASSVIRNIVGQPKSTIDVRRIMDEEKILLVRIPRGLVGEDNAALLGAMMITKIQLAAMSRVDIPESERRDFYLYVDEFQNFATEAFGTILSEARKYHLGLTLANQYIAQMPEVVRDAVFGNVSTMISFRIGATDASFIAKEFTPVFEEGDFVNMNKYNIYIKLAVNGVTSPAFSAVTLPLPNLPTADLEKIREVSRAKYSRNRVEVEQKIGEWSENASKRESGEVQDEDDEISNPGEGTKSAEQEKRALYKTYLEEEKKASEEYFKEQEIKQNEQREKKSKEAPLAVMLKNDRSIPFQKKKGPSIEDVKRALEEAKGSSNEDEAKNEDTKTNDIVRQPEALKTVEQPVVVSANKEVSRPINNAIDNSDANNGAQEIKAGEEINLG